MKKLKTFHLFRVQEIMQGRRSWRLFDDQWQLIAVALTRPVLYRQAQDRLGVSNFDEFRKIVGLVIVDKDIYRPSEMAMQVSHERMKLAAKRKDQTDTSSAASDESPTRGGEERHDN